MARYAVIFESVVTQTVEVEANSEEEAEDLALDVGNFTSVKVATGDWYVADIEEVDDDYE